jgi:hypothetical protein
MKERLSLRAKRGILLWLGHIEGDKQSKIPRFARNDRAFSLDNPWAAVTVVDPAGNARRGLDCKSDRNKQRKKNADLVRQADRGGAAGPEKSPKD